MVADIDLIPGSASWLRLARLAKLLASLILVWLGIEGAVGVVAGIIAGSIALTWHTMVTQKDFAIFVTEEEVPETTDFFIEFISVVKNILV